MHSVRKIGNFLHWTLITLNDGIDGFDSWYCQSTAPLELSISKDTVMEHTHTHNARTVIFPYAQCYDDCKSDWTFVILGSEQTNWGHLGSTHLIISLLSLMHSLCRDHTAAFLLFFTQDFASNCWQNSHQPYWIRTDTNENFFLDLGVCNPTFGTPNSTTATQKYLKKLREISISVLKNEKLRSFGKFCNFHIFAKKYGNW